MISLPYAPPIISRPWAFVEVVLLSKNDTRGELQGYGLWCYNTILNHNNIVVR